MISDEIAIKKSQDDKNKGTLKEVDKQENQLLNLKNENKEEIKQEALIDENRENEMQVEQQKMEVIAEEAVPITLPTTVIQSNNLVENYNTIYQDIKIKNETKFNLSQDILNPNVDFLDKSNIIIFHTHTCESYTPTQENLYEASRKL